MPINRHRFKKWGDWSPPKSVTVAVVWLIVIARWSRSTKLF